MSILKKYRLFDTRLIFCLAFLLLASNEVCIAQISVSLKPMVDRNYFSVIIPKRSVYSTSDYKGLNLSRFSNWQLYLSSFSGNQAAYEAVGLSYLKEIDPSIDTSMIYLGKLERNSIASFVGVDKDGNFHAVVDENNNRNFSDDNWYKFPPNLSEKDFAVNKEEVVCKIAYYDGKRVRDTCLKFDVEFLRFPSKFTRQDDHNQNGNLANIFELRMLKKSYKKGATTVNGQRYDFYVSDPYYNLYPSLSPYSMTVKRAAPNESNDLYQYYSLSDELVRIGDGLYQMPKLVKDELHLNYVKQADYGDGSIGKSMSLGRAEELITGREYYLGEPTSKYTLIDFWASWCKPCIASIPNLKAIHSTFSGKGLDVLSLAVDKRANTAKLKQLISEHGMSWDQLYMDSDKEGLDYLKKNHIQSFPTTMLIDPRGKVIYRGTSEAALIKAKELLGKILNSK